MENWNSSNKDLYYGKGGDLAGPDREHAEVSMLALHLLSASLVHLNTALVEAVLSDPTWAARMTGADRRALSPLFWMHINLYGKFDLDMNTLLDFAGASPAPGRSVSPSASGTPASLSMSEVACIGDQRLLRVVQTGVDIRCVRVPAHYPPFRSELLCTTVRSGDGRRAGGSPG